MKKLKKLTLGIVLIFQFASASEFMKNGELFLINDKEYIIRCIEGYKWVQFIEPLHGSSGTIYNPVGNPQQLFERDYYYGESLPVVCDKKIK